LFPWVKIRWLGFSFSSMFQRFRELVKFSYFSFLLFHQAFKEDLRSRGFQIPDAFDISSENHYRDQIRKWFLKAKYQFFWIC
jgi:hypothetical protein